jgi:hypothetical protein
VQAEELKLLLLSNEDLERQVREQKVKLEKNESEMQSLIIQNQKMTSL